VVEGCDDLETYRVLYDKRQNRWLQKRGDIQRPSRAADVEEQIKLMGGTNVHRNKGGEYVRGHHTGAHHWKKSPRAGRNENLSSAIYCVPKVEDLAAVWGAWVTSSLIRTTRHRSPHDVSISEGRRGKVKKRGGKKEIQNPKTGIARKKIEVCKKSKGLDYRGGEWRKGKGWVTSHNICRLRNKIIIQQKQPGKGGKLEGSAFLDSKGKGTH